MMEYGMPYDLFWKGDVYAIYHFIDAYERQVKAEQQRMNAHAHLQGAYIYHALASVSPLFRMSDKKRVRAEPYLEKPFELKPAPKPLTPKQEAERQEYMLYRDMLFRSIEEKHRLRKLNEQTSAEHIL
jgi:hypothetical protein